MEQRYLLNDVKRSYAWLGHGGRGVTEVAALHPDYRPGDRSWNRSRRAWPLTFYVSSAAALVQLVRQYAGDRMLCYGLNLRPGVLRWSDGRLRSATETDIVVAQNLLLDLDLLGSVSPSRLVALTRFLDVADEYFLDLGLRRPVRAFSGNRESHLLFAFPPLPVVDARDVTARYRQFKDLFVETHRQALDGIESRVDGSTLRGMAKVYGTRKPGRGLSRFFGGARVEDAALREYLLGLSVTTVRRSTERVPVTVGTELPAWFAGLLSLDVRLRDLWEGRGKTGDCSNSGYDFSVARYLAGRGYRDASDLGTILSLRPMGFAEHCAKGVSYLERTIGRALNADGSAHPKRQG